LAQLHAELNAANASEAVAAIRQFLDSKVDANIGQGFRPGAQGTLAEAPTLRVFLLDELAHLDPAAAAQIAKAVLSTKDSPDEWAIALRNLARGDTSLEGRDLLEQKTREMLQFERWHQSPSAGFLEAFDVAVYVGGTDLLPDLAGLVRQQGSAATTHAAFLAMDRLVINDPVTTLTALQAQPSLMQGRELTRADYFARADVRDVRQRQILEKYLLNPQISSAELTQFCATYPNANYMVSANLLTPTPTPDHATLTGRDKESLQVVRQWLADPRFDALHPQMERIGRRLEEFARLTPGD
jgi:hypothetical protein